MLAPPLTNCVFVLFCFVSEWGRGSPLTFWNLKFLFSKVEIKQSFPYSYMSLIKLIRIVEKHKELVPLCWKKSKDKIIGQKVMINYC